MYRQSIRSTGPCAEPSTDIVPMRTSKRARGSGSGRPRGFDLFGVSFVDVMPASLQHVEKLGRSVITAKLLIDGTLMQPLKRTAVKREKLRTGGSPEKLRVFLDANDGELPSALERFFDETSEVSVGLLRLHVTFRHQSTRTCLPC